MLFHVVYGLFCKRRLLFHVIYGCFRCFLARPLPTPPSRTHLAPGRAVLPRRPNIIFAPKSHANVGLAWISLDSGSNSPQFGLIHRNPVSFLTPVRHSFSDGGFPLSAFHRLCQRSPARPAAGPQPGFPAKMYNLFTFIRPVNPRRPIVVGRMLPISCAAASWFIPHNS